MNVRRWQVAVAISVAIALAGCAQDQRDQAQGVADDAIIAAQVKAKAAAIDAATVTLVQVESVHGAVTLRGVVASQKERSAIEDAARGVKGVVSVVDDVRVDPNAPTGAIIAADLELATRVHAALAAQTGVNAAKIQVDVHRGVVTLSGTLPTRAHRDVADETVRSLSGVRRLIDNLKVEKP